MRVFEDLQKVKLFSSANVDVVNGELNIILSREVEDNPRIVSRFIKSWKCYVILPDLLIKTPFLKMLRGQYIILLVAQALKSTKN